MTIETFLIIIAFRWCFPVTRSTAIKITVYFSIRFEQHRKNTLQIDIARLARNGFFMFVRFINKNLVLISHTA